MERSYTCKVVTIVTLFGLASSYISKAAPFYPQQSTFKTTKSTTSLFVKSDVPVAQTIETSNVQKQSEASLVPTNALDSSTSSVSSELNALLNKMPLTEKYSILIESYSKELSQSFPKKSENFQLIESLYSEMVEKAVVPTEKSTFSFLNAASLFCNSVQLGQSIQLIKSAGGLKCFGLSVGQLTTPLTSAAESTLVTGTKVPSDNRETEAFYATAVGTTLSLWSVLQVVGFFDSDAKPVGLILGLLAVWAGIVDVLFRKGEGFKIAAAGIDRLVFKDAKREAHCDAASFLTGYLLGIPSFCYSTDVAETLKLLQNSPDILLSYQQKKVFSSQKPVASATTTASQKSKLSTSTFTLKDMFLSPSVRRTASNSSGSNSEPVSATETAPTSSSTPSPSSTTAEKTSLVTTLNIDRQELWQKYLSASANRSTGQRDDALRSLGRVLVWLMTPIAAEVLKYGKVLVADPQRPRKVLRVLAEVALAKEKRVSTSEATSKASTTDNNTSESNSSAMSASEVSTSNADISSVVPTASADQEALLQWAYYEAELLLKQYGDVLEGLNDYITVGTSNVAECVEFLESELS